MQVLKATQESRGRKLNLQAPLHYLRLRFVIRTKANTPEICSSSNKDLASATIQTRFGILTDTTVVFFPNCFDIQC